MIKKGVIENLARIIANRVKYHAPVLYDGEVDFEALENVGIDTSLPIFKYEKSLSKPLIRAFKLAKRIVNFNLVTTQKNNCPFALYLPVEKVDVHLLQMVNKLNINYKTNSLYNCNFELDYIKIGGEELKLKYNNFCLEKYQNIEGVLTTHRKFYASGEFDVIELCNSNKFETKIEISFNKNLPNGYYYFERQRNNIMVQNLFSNEVKFFNTNLKIKDIFFSSVDGVENSTFACIKFSQSVCLKPYQKKFIYIYFGRNKVELKSQDEVDYLFKQATKMCYQNFDVRVSTFDSKFDNNFNNVLPREIWISWLNDKRDVEKENLYVMTKEKIVVRNGKRVIFSKSNYENFKRIYIYDENDFKPVEIKTNTNQNALVVGTTIFQNLHSFNLDKVRGKGQICLQFK